MRCSKCGIDNREGRKFCSGCGSPIITEAAAMPELIFIKAGTLDDTSWLDPKMHIYCDSAQRWSLIPENSQTRQDAGVVFGWVAISKLLTCSVLSRK